MMARMTHDAASERAFWRAASRRELAQRQLARLNDLLDAILPGSRLYEEKLAEIPRPLQSLEDLQQIGYTFKTDLQPAAHGEPWPANLSRPLEHYVRWHQTSGTHGHPLPVLDTPQDWQWWLECWQYVLDAGYVHPHERAMLAFSFGPFIGFWCAHDALVQRGCLVLPTGGMSSAARLELLARSGATVLCCTPSYALHLAEVGAQRGIQTNELDVRLVIVAGEPGGSLPAMRDRIESAFGAKVLDHAGASEVGAWGYGDEQGAGLHVTESEFIAEFISLSTGQSAQEGELAELVLTNLGRTGYPALRYRTGDLVRPIWEHGRATGFVFLEGGVVGRTDDMLTIRGVNIFPSAVEQIVRSFPEVLEYRAVVQREAELDRLELQIEDRLAMPERVAEELRLRLGLRVEVQCVPLGSLPRSEGKARRWVDER